MGKSRQHNSLVFINSHPIQYFAPLYQFIEKLKLFELEVIYCSDETVNGGYDKEFGTRVKWDIPVLSGYDYKFLKNHSPRPSLYNGFTGIVNFGIIKYLYKKPKSVVVVHGWNYATNVMAIIAGRMLGHVICLRGETPYKQEVNKKGFKQVVKKAWLKFLFLFIDRFLYIGTQNQLFYRSYGIADRKLIFAPYAVDNERFREVVSKYTRVQARERLNVPEQKVVILFSGKYIPKKRPMDLVRAIKMLRMENVLLIMTGEGELRSELEQFIKTNALERSIVLTGFVNQSDIPFYYRAANIFVMCSSEGETWGLSVNEAMNFELPIVVSQATGCSDDLVKENGFVFETGNIEELAKYLKQLVSDETLRNKMGKRSAEIIQEFSFQKITESIAAV